jgi:microcystin degradation protein MlrC
MRIAIVGVSIEIMLACPVRTGREALQEYSAQAMLDGDLWMIRGMLARLAEAADTQAVPLHWTTALPGGPMTEDAYASVKCRTLRLLAEHGPFAGILVANHGALEVEGLDCDADTDFVMAIRRLAGPDVPIGVALDLHGDMTPELLQATTVFSVLRTAPHRDDRQTGYRVADQLIRVLKTGIRPRKAAVSIPILAPGEVAVTSLTPGRELYGALPSYDAKPGMIEANILLGFAWNDLPRTAVTALAVSDGDADVARAEALDLAARIWSQRGEFRLRMETAEVDAGLALAARCPERPVLLSDSGDNTTAGAAGDLTLVLQAALDHPDIDDPVVAGITAPRTVAALIAAGVGRSVAIELGAEHVSRPESHRRVTATVEACGETLLLGGFQPYRSQEAAWARVRIGRIVATFHALPIGITTPHHFEAMGIHPTAHKAYVVKLGYLHPQLEDSAARHILLLSDGTSQLDMTRLTWKRLHRPAYPLDRDFEWTPEAGLYGDR